MRLILTTCLLFLAIGITFSQNVKYESKGIYFYRYPMKPLDKSVRTYSCRLEDLGDDLSPWQRDTLQRAMSIPGITNVRENGDVQLELIVNELSITNRETRDKPLETEQNGKKSTLHQYWYDVTYSFPMKIRVVSKGQTITEQDLTGFFNTKFYPTDRSSLTALEKEYDRDYTFKNNLRSERISQRKEEIRSWLFSNYGYGLVLEGIEIGYIKDKNDEYSDLTQALTLLYVAYTYADKKKDYVDDTFKTKVNEAIAMWEKALLESSEDKKARIDQKVTAMIQCNIALAYYGLNDFDKAEEWLQKIRKAASETERVAHSLRRMLQDKRARFAANGLIAGMPAATASTNQPTSIGSASAAPARNYIVITPGDTVNVRFIIPSHDVMPFGDTLWLEDQIVVMKDNNRVEIYPSQIHSYCYKGIVRESLTWVKDMNVTPWLYEKKFCQRVLSGAIPVYRYSYVTTSMRDHTEKIVKSTIYYKKGDQLLEVMFLNFNRGVSKLVADYPELSERVKSGAYQREDFVKVMKEYNAWAKSKPKG
ncbi:tetratricopeptide repeat protein [Ohtaekwangia koreensis]|uniref:Uncharacterized protein n=1 Tax=Ohtaekwangia koreensis TaxID=688867 RepID=A0A1T5M7W7_9BACT|nr:tetratricopeptide repeat protein [Ohtaekwangia koreensis]SKC84327.1 hypothetical protein SAMN05660236_4750 [Ohtaekwangia koreensis]